LLIIVSSDFVGTLGATLAFFSLAIHLLVLISSDYSVAQTA